MVVVSRAKLLYYESFQAQTSISSLYHVGGEGGERVHILRIGLIVGMLGFQTMSWQAEARLEGHHPRDTIHHPHPHLLAGFGFSLSADREGLLVGVPYQVRDGRESGGAYLIHPRTGQIEQAFHSPNPTDGALFGLAVSLAEEVVAIGAPHAKDQAGAYTGAAFILDRSTGTLRHRLSSPFPLPGAFGHAVWVEGSRVFVSDPTASTSTQFYAGAVFSFDLHTGEGLHAFVSPTIVPGSPSRFGQSVAPVGHRIYIGAPLEKHRTGRSGAVYGYDSLTGRLVQRLDNPEPMDASFFGWAVAARENALLVGAHGHQHRFRGEGAAYVFDLGSGTLRLTLNNPFPNEEAHFGKSVAVTSDWFIVGAPGTTRPGAPEGRRGEGAVYVFDRRTGTLKGSLKNPAAMEGADDRFGESLSIVGDDLFIGVPLGGNGRELDAGLIYRYHLPKREEAESENPAIFAPTPPSPLSRWPGATAFRPGGMVFVPDRYCKTVAEGATGFAGGNRMSTSRGRPSKFPQEGVNFYPRVNLQGFRYPSSRRGMTGSFSYPFGQDIQANIFVE